MLAAVIVILQALAAAQVPSTWFGTWRLNVEKSTYEPGLAPYGEMLVETVDAELRRAPPPRRYTPSARIRSQWSSNTTTARSRSRT